MFPVPARVFRAASNVAWSLSTNFNAILPEGELPNPSWAPCRLLKSRERMQMMTGVPRKTPSLCPECNIEVTDAVMLLASWFGPLRRFNLAHPWDIEG